MLRGRREHLVPFDEVVDAMKQVGDLMPREVCCSGLGGLAITPASKALEAKLAGGCGACGSRSTQPVRKA